MLVIDIVLMNRISEELEDSARKLMQLEERVLELFKQERQTGIAEAAKQRILTEKQSGIAEEIQGLTDLSKALKQIASLYAAVEAENMDYLEEVCASCNRQSFQEWSVPDWIFQLLI